MLAKVKGTTIPYLGVESREIDSDILETPVTKIAFRQSSIESEVSESEEFYVQLAQR